MGQIKNIKLHIVTDIKPTYTNILTKQYNVVGNSTRWSHHHGSYYGRSFWRHRIEIFEKWTPTRQRDTRLFQCKTVGAMKGSLVVDTNSSSSTKQFDLTLVSCCLL